MKVRQHLSQREVADTLPLLTKSAVVTDVSAMDRSRNREVIDAIHETLGEHGGDEWERRRPADPGAREEWLRDRLNEFDHLDRNASLPLNDLLPAYERTGRPGEKLAALQARYLQPYPSLLRITVETDAPIEFVAGQYLAIRYQGISRVYSVASSPNRDDIEFCIRRVPGGHLTSELAEDLSAGDRITLRGSYGDLTLQDPSQRDVVFLATGTGVAPLKSMIDYTFEEGRDRYGGRKRHLWLFLGAAWKDELPYYREFRSLGDAHDNFHFVPTLSRENYLTDWSGETAYVQYSLVKYLDDEALGDRTLPDDFERYRNEPPREPIDARLDPSSMDVYACGINAMVYGLVDAVERLGVPPARTEFEGFG